MQYFSELPEITSSSIDKESHIELEVSGEVERLPDVGDDEIVFIGKMGATVYLILGSIVEYEYIKPEESASGNGFTRLKMEGSCVTLF
jgi:dihydroxyacetone kinase